MSYESSAEVAEDFRQSLEELSGNLRVEINNLTIIARENYEHAQAIADVIQDHIRKVAPQKKLPALYVLDSVVKNVGTPYTLYFSRKLMSTFMDAYASVDQGTRRKMDEMLRTWKEPIPGSIDTRPPFPPDVVRPIETALIKARTKAFEGQQENFHAQQQLLGRGRSAVPYRNTPTPPGARPSSYQHGPYGQQPFPGPNGYPANGQPTAYPIHPNAAHSQQPANLTPVLGPGGPYSIPQQPASVPPGLPYQPPPAHTGYGGQAPIPKVSVEGLLGDLRQLIASGSAELAQSPWDTGKQTRLKALVDLQGVLQSANLPEEQLVLIKNQVAELAVNIRAPNVLAAPPPHQSAAFTHTPTPPPVAVAQPVAPPASVPPAGVSIDSLFGSGALAALLAGRGTSTTPQQNSTPTPIPIPPAANVPAIRSPLAQPTQLAPGKAALPADALSLVSLLRKQGLLPAGSQPATPTPPLPAGVPPPPPPLGVAGGLAQTLLSAPGAEIPLKASALKQFRPHLIPLLFDALGKPCTQCGRRFPNDDEGKRRKTAHLDWHFRVHQRIAEAEKKGQHRSWYVDQMDWVHSREVLDVDTVDGTSLAITGSAANDVTAGGATGNATAKSAGPKVPWIPVPDDPHVNTTCPICQEKFEQKWLDEAQEWVWMDAVRIGDRVYHASCHAEATAGVAAGVRGGTPGARATPDRVLGKRKAEDGLAASLRVKAKAEGL